MLQADSWTIIGQRHKAAGFVVGERAKVRGELHTEHKVNRHGINARRVAAMDIVRSCYALDLPMQHLYWVCRDINPCLL